MKYIFILVVLQFNLSIIAQNWQLKKTTDDFKAYTSETENSKVKSYKVVALLSKQAECIFKVMTDYENYESMFKEIKEHEIIKKTDTSLVAYSLFESPWPVQDRDLVSYIKIKKNDSTMYITTIAVQDKKYKRKTNVVRMFDYIEKCKIEKIEPNKTKFTITGHFDAGGAIPAWLQNMYIIDGVEDLIELLKIKCH